jgi:hypothetical protein
MERFSSVDEILDFAIAREIEANRFYSGLAERMVLFGSRGADGEPGDAQGL